MKHGVGVVAKDGPNPWRSRIGVYSDQEIVATGAICIGQPGIKGHDSAPCGPGRAKYVTTDGKRRRRRRYLIPFVYFWIKDQRHDCRLHEAAARLPVHQDRRGDRQAKVASQVVGYLFVCGSWKCFNVNCTGPRRFEVSAYTVARHPKTFRFSARSFFGRSLPDGTIYGLRPPFRSDGGKQFGWHTPQNGIGRALAQQKSLTRARPEPYPDWRRPSTGPGAIAAPPDGSDGKRTAGRGFPS